MPKLLASEQRYDIGKGYEATVTFDGEGRPKYVRISENAPNAGAGWTIDALVAYALANVISSLAQAADTEQDVQDSEPGCDCLCHEGFVRDVGNGCGHCQPEQEVSRDG